MNTKAHLLTTLILYNIRPKVEISYPTLDLACILFYILEGKEVGVTEMISQEMRIVALSGHTLGGKYPTSLTFLRLIMVLSRRAGVVFPLIVHETTRSVINDDYVGHHCTPRLVGARATQPEAVAPPTGLVHSKLLFCYF